LVRLPIMRTRFKFISLVGSSGVVVSWEIEDKI
jgi:hypothetical protein